MTNGSRDSTSFARPKSRIFFAERHAVNVLHRDEARVLALADLVDVRDVGVIL